MSVILGVICTISLIFIFITSYIRQGEIPERFGAALVVTLVFAVAGLVLGALARMDGDRFKFIPTLGVVINALVVIVMGVVLWIGLN